MSDELKTALEGVQSVVAELRANHEQVTAKYDGLLVEKENRMKEEFVQLRTQMDEISKSQKRAAIIAETRDGLTEEQRQHGSDFRDYLRRGDAGVTDLLTRATQASLGNDAEGGYVASPAVQASVERLQLVASPIRSIANVVTISAASYKIPVDRLGLNSGWVAEMESRPQTLSPDLAMIEPPMGEVYANVPVTQTLLDDAAINIEAWIAESIAERFNFVENVAYISGDGVKKPRGFLQEPTAAQAGVTEPAYGSLGFVATGANGAFLTTASAVGNVFRDTVARLKPGYRPNAQWVMNRTTEAEVAKLKDTTGAPLWVMSMRDNLPSTLAGFPITVADDMPDLATTNAFPIAFGDFRAGYQIVDRIGIRTIRDPYSSKPFVLIYATKRGGGAVKRFEAIKLIRSST